MTGGHTSARTSGAASGLIVTSEPEPLASSIRAFLAVGRDERPKASFAADIEVSSSSEE